MRIRIKNYKFKYVFISALFFISLTGCKKISNSEQSGQGPEINLPQTSVDSVQVLTDGQYCYEYTIKLDTYAIKLNLKNGQVTGEMAFNHYEKDSSHGTITGWIKEDILHLNYRYQSEGMTNTQTMYFKVRGDLLITGIGEVSSVGDTAFVTDLATVKYEGEVYVKVDCQ